MDWLAKNITLMKITYKNIHLAIKINCILRFTALKRVKHSFGKCGEFLIKISVWFPVFVENGILSFTLNLFAGVKISFSIC